MNNQEAFDRSAKHLLTQAIPATNKKGMCAYRGVNNTKCAIGALIPDDIYNVDMEGRPVKFLIDNNNAIKNLFENVNRYFLRDLQRCHDRAAMDGMDFYGNDLKIFKQLIIKNFSDLAINYNLNTDVLREV